MRCGRLATLAAVASVVVVPSTAFGDPGPDSPTATHDNPSSCLGAERATRNSVGGDRAQGGFGPAQAEWIAEVKAAGLNYGQWLAEWKADC
jgi:hypothetical protein